MQEERELRLQHSWVCQTEALEAGASMTPAMMVSASVMAGV